MTCQAEYASKMITAYCRAIFVKDNGDDITSDEMGSIMTEIPSLIDTFDHIGYLSHKDLPKRLINSDLGTPIGSGIYGAWAMRDGSYLLLTCCGELAWWLGTFRDHAQWHDLPVDPYA